MEKIEFREIVELFLCRSIHDIREERIMPNVNFKFNEDGINLFNDVISHPFVMDGAWTQDADADDLALVLNNKHNDTPTIYVDDSVKFFQSLMDITNATIKLNAYYGHHSSARTVAINTMDLIWARMGISDINDVNLFLNRQWQFLNNMTFDSRDFKKIGTFYDNDVNMETVANMIYVESTRGMLFAIKNGNEVYYLPFVLYDIDACNNCYVYGIQNKSNYKSKSIERKIYKLNKGIENPNVHPSKVLAFMLFVQELRKKGISKVIVPSMQIFSYRYHEVLSSQARSDLKAARKAIKELPHSLVCQRNLAMAEEWYGNVYQKQDLISYLKTEELFNVMYRVADMDSNIDIINEVNLQGDSLNLHVKRKTT